MFAAPSLSGLDSTLGMDDLFDDDYLYDFGAEVVASEGGGGVEQARPATSTELRKRKSATSTPSLPPPQLPSAPPPPVVGEEELTEAQKLERRERNREHAKRSRLRKKFLLESLQEQINGLQVSKEASQAFRTIKIHSLLIT